MRAKSQALEIQVKLNSRELKTLKNKSLKGILNFSNGESTCKINISLDYSEDQEDLVEVSQDPQKCYFGYADSVSFSINSFFYNQLKSQGSYGNRFYGAIGKLEIKIED